MCLCNSSSYSGMRRPMTPWLLLCSIGHSRRSRRWVSSVFVMVPTILKAPFSGIYISILNLMLSSTKIFLIIFFVYFSFVRDDKIYLKKQTSASASNVCSSQERSFVRVVSLTSGALIGQYLVDLRDVELLNVDSHGRTILADTKACKLRIYDKPTKRRVGVMEKLELVYENELEALRDATYLSFTRDDKLCLVKNKSSILYYSIYSAI